MFDLGRSFIAAAARMPAAPAISDGPITWGYAQWLDHTRRVAGGLEALGLTAGDHVVALVQNRLEAATLHLACQLSGLIITPVNWRATPEELDYVLGDAGAKALVFETLTAATVAEAPTAAPLPRIALDDGLSPPATHTWQTLASHAAIAPESRAQVDATSVMLYTSGTTGKGKGVPRSHRAERAAAVAHVAQNQYARGEVTLGVMPLYHTMGVRSLLASILINGHFVCQRRFDPFEALRLIQIHRITNLYLVPTLYHDLIHCDAFQSAAIASVTKLGFAGQAMTDGLLKHLQEAFNPQLFVNHYGSSEIYTFTIEPHAPGKPGSAGKAGLNQEIRVVPIGASDPHGPLSPGQEGQIIASLAGDEAFQGYWRRPDADAKALHQGWYFTGDVGYFDAEGDLFVTGRVDDMMVSGGENILPAEIESVLSLHEAVGEVAVVGLPHERWGQQVTAFITRRAPVAAEELERFCLASGLAPFKRPRAYVFVKGIPKSPVGKLLRRLLVAGEYQSE